MKVDKEKLLSIFEAMGYGAGGIVQSSEGHFYEIGCVYFFGHIVNIKLRNNESIPKLFSAKIYDTINGNFFNEVALTRPSKSSLEEVTLDYVDWHTDLIKYKGFVIGKLVQNNEDINAYFFYKPSLVYSDDMLEDSFSQPVKHVSDAKQAALLHITTISPEAFEIKSKVKNLVEECFA